MSSVLVTVENIWEDTFLSIVPANIVLVLLYVTNDDTLVS